VYVGIKKYSVAALLLPQVTVYHIKRNKGIAALANTHALSSWAYGLTHIHIRQSLRAPVTTIIYKHILFYNYYIQPNS